MSSRSARLDDQQARRSLLYVLSSMRYRSAYDRYPAASAIITVRVGYYCTEFTTESKHDGPDQSKDEPLQTTSLA
eukprot:scaffold31968_cov63-Attheya_sp.AAC.3